MTSVALTKINFTSKSKSYQIYCFYQYNPYPVMSLSIQALCGIVLLVDTPLCKSENMNPYSTSAKHEWNMDSYFHLLQSGVSDLHHEQSGVWKKGNPIFHYI